MTMMTTFASCSCKWMKPLNMVRTLRQQNLYSVFVYQSHSPKFTQLHEARWISTSLTNEGINVHPRKITSRLAADQLIRDLNKEELQRLNQALDDYNEELRLENPIQDDKPSFNVLTRMAVTNSIPFIGFGFLDNAIMIAAGEYIDLHIGVVFGISTMAAAALGNMISDVAGIGLAGYVETLAAQLGFEVPKLTQRQLFMRSTKLACHTGRAIGIVIGCILGMFPLLLVPSKEKDECPDDVEV